MMSENFAVSPAPFRVAGLLRKLRPNLTTRFECAEAQQGNSILLLLLLFEGRKKIVTVGLRCD